MDLTHLSLFSGVGGLDLAAEMAGFCTVGQCERDEYAIKVLEKHWPDLPRWRDIAQLTKETFHAQTGLRTVDLISGGFPCQPFSVAGKRGGEADDRYLWPEMLRVISGLRPAWVLGENVAGIVSLALDQVLSDLEAADYACRAYLVPACAVDAPHRRDRVAIVAHDNRLRRGSWRPESERQQRPPRAANGGCDVAAPDGEREQQSAREQSQSRERAGDSGEDVPDTMRSGFLPRGESYRQCRKTGIKRGGDVANADDGCGTMRRNGQFSAASEACGQRNHHGGRTPEYGAGQWRLPQSGLGRVADGVPAGLDGPVTWPPEPDIPRVATGVANRVSRLRCLGNAVVPRQFYPFFAAIAQLL